jgi:hypothetical protein
MNAYGVKLCSFCQCSIAVDQRWVRERIYDPRSTGQDAAYRHFHAEPFEGQEVSCWEGHLMEREIPRIAVRENAGETVMLVA